MKEIVTSELLQLLLADRKTDLLSGVVQSLHVNSGADFTFVAEVDSQFTVATTHVLYTKSGQADNFSYELNATPCADVLDQSTCVLSHGVQEAYPKDQLLIDMGIQSYIGTQLTDMHGQPIGILVALFQREVNNSEQISSLFSVFSGVISREFDRLIKSADVVLAKKVLDSANDGIIITDADRKIMYVNTAMCKVTGYSNVEIVGQTPALFKSDKNSSELYQELWRSLSDNHTWSGEIWNRVKSGEIRPFSLTITAIFDENDVLSHYSGIFQDIFERKKTEEQVLYQATHDLLTGLKNRYAASDKLEELVALTRRYDRSFSILLIDIDHFKAINDNHGHQIGDQVLEGVSQIIQDNVRSSDMACRWGGEEFLIICQECNVADAEDLAEKLRVAIEQTIFINNINMTASFGVAQFRQYEASTSLLIRADDYLYQAKENGRNCIVSSEKVLTTQ